MIKIVFRATLLIFLTIRFTGAQPPTKSSAADSWVDSMYAAMSPEARIGQLFMVKVYSKGNEQHHQVIDQLVKKNHIGGLVFMDGNPEKQVTLTNRFQAGAVVPLLIGMDLTQGLGTRLEGTIRFPDPLTLGALQNNDLIYEMGAEIARQMKHLGIHINFGLAANVYQDLGNPADSYRAFGTTPDHVAQKTKAYMQGLKDNGVLAVAGYFPHHPQNTEASSFLSSPDAPFNREMITQPELSPFKVLSDGDLDGIMTGRLYLPSVKTREKTEPPTPLSTLLKEELDFQGLLFADRLDKKTLPGSYENGHAEKEAFLSGTDILLFSTQIPTAVKLIKKAIKKDEQAELQLERTVRKILKAKYEVGLNHRKPLNTDNLYAYLNNADALALRYKLYRQAVTMVKDQNRLLPIKKLDGRYFASLSFGDGNVFQNTLDNYAFFNHYQKSYGDEKILMDQLKNYHVVFVGLFQSLLEEEIDFLKELSQKTEVVINHFGNVYELRDLNHFRQLIHIGENTPVTQALLAEACFGANDVSGKIPVHISGSLPQGTGISIQKTGRLAYDLPENVRIDSRILSQIDDIMTEAIGDKATPGGQVLIAKDGKIIFEKAYGYYTYDSAKPVTEETIYDIASVTKVAATMQAFMFLHERGFIDLDKKISVFLPELKGSNKENMILRDILTHQAGLWPYMPFWKQTVEDSSIISSYYRSNRELDFQHQVSPGLYSSGVVKDSIWNWVKDSRLVRKKGREPFPYRYSDLGYYLIQRLIENHLNQSMEEFLQQNFYDPMGLTSLSYLPLCKFPLSRIAPTENDNYFRNTLVYGVVHDEGAALFGGVAGHAGLFSNARDLAKLMQMHIQGGTYGGHRFFQPGTIGLFTSRQYDSNRRGLGWDKPAMAQSHGPASRFASGKTFGHTGFTGTAVWADPEFNLVYVFLSNRIHPDADNRKLIQNNIRTRIQEVIYKAIWSYAQYDCTD